MRSPKPKQEQNLRELRRGVILPASMLTDSGCAAACILNISSRGLMIRTSPIANEGSLVELRRGEHAILARVVWRQGSRAGLRAEERLPVEDILTLGQASALRVTAGNAQPVEWRKPPRTHDESRFVARAVEFMFVVAIGVFFAATAYTAVRETLARPLAYVRMALSD